MVYDSWIEAQAGQNHHLFQRRTGVWPPHGLPGKLRMSTTTPLSRVVATLTLWPNSWRTRVLPFDMQSTSGLMQGEDHVGSFGPPVQEMPDGGEPGDGAIPQAACGDVLQVGAEVALDPSDAALQIS